MVRIKHRYLLLSILTPTASNLASTHHPLAPSLTPSTLLALLRNHISVLFGDYGLGTTAAGLKITYLSTATATAIVRCPRASYRMVWAALSFVTTTTTTTLDTRARAGQDGRCVIRVVRVSGTIRKAEEEAVRRARREIVRLKMLVGEDEDEDEEGAAAASLGGVGGGEKDGRGGGVGLKMLGDEDEDMDDDDSG